MEPEKKRLTIMPAKAASLPASGRVEVIGTLVDLSPESLVVDDGTGSAVAKLSLQTIRYGSVGKGKTASVIGRLKGKEMMAEIVRDFSLLDISLYQKAKDFFEREVVR